MVKKVIILLILFMILPVLRLFIENEFDSVSSYSAEYETLEDFYDDRDLVYTTPYIFLEMGEISHDVDLGLLDSDSVYVDVGGTYEKAYQYGTAPSGFSWYPGQDNIQILNMNTYESIRLYDDGSVYDDYFFMNADTIRFQQGVIPDYEALDFYGAIFFSDPDYDYSSLDLNEERLVGYFYDPDDDTSGYSALELGEIAVFDGLLGMIPREVDGVIEFPLFSNVVFVAFASLDYLAGSVAAG
jgi:hypothetical protein